MEIIGILEKMDFLIRMESTGRPADFASRLAISRRTLFAYLGIMKELGAPISYSPSLASYTYCNDGKLVMSFSRNK